MTKPKIAQKLGLSVPETALLVELAKDPHLTAYRGASAWTMGAARKRLLARGLILKLEPRQIGHGQYGRRYAWVGGKLSERGRAMALAALELGWAP